MMLWRPCSRNAGHQSVSIDRQRALRTRLRVRRLQQSLIWDTQSRRIGRTWCLPQALGLADEIVVADPNAAMARPVEPDPRREILEEQDDPRHAADRHHAVDRDRTQRVGDVDLIGRQAGEVALVHESELTRIGPTPRPFSDRCRLASAHDSGITRLPPNSAKAGWGRCGVRRIRN